jgi:hypothetical protein
VWTAALGCPREAQRFWWKSGALAQRLAQRFLGFSPCDSNEITRNNLQRSTEAEACFRTTWIVQQCSQELRKYSVPFYNVQEELPRISDASLRILIGAAFYSLPELELIDAIVPRLQTDDPAERLQIFEVMSCKSQADFEACIPGIGKVLQTPVVGIWKNGTLIEKASVHNAAKILRSHYGVYLPNSRLIPPRSTPRFWPYTV